MRMLVTGDAGLVGTAFVALARARGHECAGFDLVRGQDLADLPSVRAAVRGCAVVVHLAAVDEEAAAPIELQPATRGPARRIFAVNVGGTANLLVAAADAGATRVVLASSVDVLGCFLGQGLPARLPIDDEHPVDPKGSYAASKVAAEAQVRAWSTATGGSAVILRPPGVVSDGSAAAIRRMRAADPESEWLPYWEYGAFLHVDDLAAALLAAATAPLSGTTTLLVGAADLSSAGRTSLDLAEQLAPGVPIRGRDRFEREPYRALLDSGRAQRLLGWSPRHRWHPAP